MTAQNIAELLLWMKEDKPVTLTFNAADLRSAIEMASGGPEIMSTAQAAKVFGWDPKRWRGWAKQGRVSGAYQEENGDWRLPREGCRQRLEEEIAAGRRAPNRNSAPVASRGAPLHSIKLGAATAPKRKRRGPRRKAV